MADPWEIDGAQTLNRVTEFLARFIIYPSAHAADAHVLWIAHTHLMDAWDSTPRIAFLSPEPGSGKSRCLELSELLVPRPILGINVSANYLIRKFGSEDGRPTLLYDEIDTVFGPKARENEEIRGLLNAGHRRGAVSGRCVARGKTIETEDFSAYAAVAMAGLGDLPDTILTRSVNIRMRRRAPGEAVLPFRRRQHGPEGERLRDDLADWATMIEPQVTGAWPEMPDSINDRNADVWEALLAIADAAGGHWPARARVAAVALVAQSAGDRQSLGIKLLADLRDVFGQSDQMPTERILIELCKKEESPWGDLRGKPLDARGLSQRLGKYDIKPITIRYGSGTPKGYRRTDLHDAWQRYLSLSLQNSATSATPETIEPQPVRVIFPDMGSKDPGESYLDARS